MKKFNFQFIMLAIVSLSSVAAMAQEKVWVSGAARGVMYADQYATEGDADTTTARRQESGHTMVDLGVNIRPNENIFIQGMVRVRNDYGGFWGSGVTFDVRQLTIKGILGGFLKYQLGDIDYRLSPYTMYNSQAMVNSFAGEITGAPLNQVQYDLFYTDDNTWRQQGGAIDFALEFTSVIQEAQFNMFTTRLRPTNFTTLDDRLYSGGSVTIVQSDRFKVGGQYVNLYDLSGTSDATVFLRNPVYSLSAEYNYPLSNSAISAALETGRSTMRWEGDAAAPELEDFFYDVRLAWNQDKGGLGLELGYREVGPNFRSPGAQTMRINYNRLPQAYGRIGNNQSARTFSIMDLSRDASLYQTQLSAILMDYDPRYDNATPYGVSTPNRSGFSLKATYADPSDRWKATINADRLQDVVGLGTTALTSYMTGYANLELALDKMLGIEDRDVTLSGGYGMQNSARTGENAYETIDLSASFYNVNLKVKVVGELSAIGEFRNWSSAGSTLLAERDNYTQIIDFIEYDIDYSESVWGAGFVYEFTENSALRLMYQNFAWEDSTSELPYDISTWTVFFTMKF